MNEKSFNGMETPEAWMAAAWEAYDDAGRMAALMRWQSAFWLAITATEAALQGLTCNVAHAKEVLSAVQWQQYQSWQTAKLHLKNLPSPDVFPTFLADIETFIRTIETLLVPPIHFYSSHNNPL